MPASQSRSEPSPPAPAGGRRQRSDARRNRDRLVEAARRALSSGEGAFSLEGVAREAGVGIGTLYRNFGNREQLVEAVYAAEVENLTARAAELARRMPPREALRAWLIQFAAFAATKRGVVEVLGFEAITGPGPMNHTGSLERVTAAITPLLEAGARDGSLRADVDPQDVVMLVAGALMPVRTDAAQTERLLNLVLDALRPA
ncbi:TetR/AcrR family transcriptional regulator [Glycomyces sp. A-F 0318]|uniref:TetR/AcrR family transcriptional regulator n=1 Tax=Glycomyces amatae TaxID=2881355 RepID=UPI001E3CAD18|nr:TetR/AcrR family transcriptional regulator [Glycomyces amatae]MCD0444383.1 TetR/AcrR family transcriptional regulator [Glycomyces amatae]